MGKLNLAGHTLPRWIRVEAEVKLFLGGFVFFCHEGVWLINSYIQPTKALALFQRISVLAYTAGECGVCRLYSGGTMKLAATGTYSEQHIFQFATLWLIKLDGMGTAPWLATNCMYY